MITYEEAEKMLQNNQKIPYPNIPKVYYDPKYAQMLYDDYAGSLGELTAITQYIYQHICTQDEDVKKILKKIAIEEMRHLEILGEILKKFNKDPRYIDSNENKWCSKNVKYEFNDFKQMINHNIHSEEVAIQGYRRLSMYTRNFGLRKIFERIILDEKTHREIFIKMIKD